MARKPDKASNHQREMTSPQETIPQYDSPQIEASLVPSPSFIEIEPEDPFLEEQGPLILPALTLPSIQNTGGHNFPALTRHAGVSPSEQTIPFTQDEPTYPDFSSPYPQPEQARAWDDQSAMGAQRVSIPRPLRARLSPAILIISLALVVILVLAGLWQILGGTFFGVHSHNSSATLTSAVQNTSSTTPVSPLLFGTNLGLFDSNDQVLTSPATRNLLQQMHARIIRMPVRSSLPEVTEVAAAEIIKSLGAIPLVILRGAVDNNVLADDSRIINDMNRIFGNSIVYYEYGNEEDLLGINVTRYTASWNAIVPQLQHLALHGQFIGPVTYHYDRTYLTTFLQKANPRPTEVSWHEYTCDDSWSTTMCISHIDNWTRHFSDARAAMTAAIGTALPIMITEWNYAPNAVPNDGKNNNSGFMATWTTRALQTLAANRIFASMQYSCTNTAIALISDNGTPTTQGTIFSNQYAQMIIHGQQPSPVAGQPQQGPTVTGATPNATLTGVPNTHTFFSFEDGGTDGWSGNSAEITQVQNTTTLALDGKHALQVTLSNVARNDFPSLSVGRSNLAIYPVAGQTVTMYIYLPSNSVSLATKIFIMDNAYHWFSPDTFTELSPGVWNPLIYTLPSSFNGQPRQLGIQFNNLASAPLSVDLYLDKVGWS